MKSEYARLCATKKSREALAKQVVDLAARCGAKVIERRDDPKYREIGLDIGFGPYRVMMTFSGTSSVGAFLGHWYTETRSDATYPMDFGGSIRGTVNQFHGQKATTCEETFEGFLGSIERGLECLADYETEADRQQRIGGDDTSPAKPKFYECEICGAWHPATWDGDCRQDDARFFPELLNERYGCDGWESVDMLDVACDPTPSRFLPNRPLGLD